MDETIRSAILGLVLPDFTAAFPAVPLAVDNDPFDWNNLPPLFVTMQIETLGGNQIGPSATPKTRKSGFVYICGHVRKGLGTAQLSTVLQWIEDHLKYKSPGPVRLQAPEPDGSGELKGYYYRDLKVSFYADEA